MFLLNLDSHDLLAKYTRDLAETRIGRGGAPAVIAPDSGWGAVRFNPAPTWQYVSSYCMTVLILTTPHSSAFILIPYWIYQYKGDKRVLAEHYDSMKEYVGFELGRSTNNIASTVLGDWVNPETSPGGGNPPEDQNVSGTAFL